VQWFNLEKKDIVVTCNLLNFYDERNTELLQLLIVTYYNLIATSINQPVQVLFNRLLTKCLAAPIALFEEQHPYHAVAVVRRDCIVLASVKF